jgi:hypothetical protein
MVLAGVWVVVGVRRFAYQVRGIALYKSSSPGARMLERGGAGSAKAREDCDGFA